MVLKRLLPFSFALLAAGAGCMPRPDVVRASQKTPIAVAFVMDKEQESGVAEVPEQLKNRIKEKLRERNLDPYEIPFASYSNLFVPVRDTQRRLARLSNSEAPLTLLVETKAVYFSQLNGRYRWVVYSRLSAARKDGTVPPLTAAMEQAAFVDFAHEREPQAIEAVSADIANRVGGLLDDYLGSETGAPSAARAPPVKQPIYFVMVDRFANGDRANDGAVDLADPAAFHGGDLQGVIDHLDELKAMGVGTIWLSPVFKMRTDKFFEHGAFHGYWVEDITRVEPRFGDEALLRRLSDELHARGMALVLDIVLNHVAMDSKLTAERPGWFHRAGPLRKWDDPVELVNHDVHGLPDLAQENPEVYAYLLESTLTWIESVRPDGFRLDAVKHVPLTFWSRFNGQVRQKTNGEFLLLGEMLDGDPSLIARTQREGRFSAMFDFPLYFALVDVFCRDQSPLRLGAALSSDRVYADPDSLVTLLDNHDLPRIASDCGGNLDRVRDALTFQLTARGTPALTYGTEAGLTGAKEPENRGDMRFDKQPLRPHIAKLLQLRREHPSLDAGAPRILKAGGDLFVYARLMPDEAAVVAVNRGEAAADFELPRELSGQGIDALSGKKLEIKPLVVPARATLLVLVTPETSDGFADAAASAFRQWRAGERTREVVFKTVGAPADSGSLYLVGSGLEMGAWKPDRALGPSLSDRTIKVRLPIGSVYEFKLVARGQSGEIQWAPADNSSLFVTEGDEPLVVPVMWEKKS